MADLDEKFVTIHHPGLPGRPVTQIHRKGLQLQLAAGWVEGEPTPDTADPEQVDADPNPADPTPPRARAAGRPAATSNTPDPAGE